jgi:hypothetical protein
MYFTSGLMVIIMMLINDNEIKLDSKSWFGKTEEALINQQLYLNQATQITVYILGMAG